MVFIGAFDPLYHLSLFIPHYEKNKGREKHVFGHAAFIGVADCYGVCFG
jgi:hypothetical protein